MEASKHLINPYDYFSLFLKEKITVLNEIIVTKDDEI